MLSSAFALTALAAVAAAQAPLTINTPGRPVQCQPVKLTWSGGSPPYYVSVLPGQSIQNPYETLFLGQASSDTEATWTCDIGVNTTLTFGVKDSVGSVNWSAFQVVGASPTNDSSCIGMNAVRDASISATMSSTAAAAGTGAAGSAAGTTSAAASASGAASASASASARPASGALSTVSGSKAFIAAAVGGAAYALL